MTHPLTTDGGFECCVYCWRVFGADELGDTPNQPGIGMGINYTEGDYCNAETGHEYETVMDSEAGTPLAHPECYKEWKAATRPDDEADLTEWSR